MKEHIIVVDDDSDIREIVHFVLVQHGFKVDVASNGAQLQTLLAHHLPDLIILDVMMPGESGYHLCRTLRQQASTQCVPIMIITAHTEEVYEHISQDLGAVVHMTKPFHPLALAHMVQHLLSTPKQHWTDYTHLP